MTSRSKTIREAVREALETAGAERIEFSHSGTCHQRFDFEVNGTAGRFVFASTPKSSRSVANAAATAKRIVREYAEGRRGPKKQVDTETPGGPRPPLPG